MTTTERMTTKAIILQAIETLPDEVDLDDALEHIVLVHTLTRRIEQADQGRLYTQEEVEQMMAEWQD
jgi:hypothetical protein